MRAPRFTAGLAALSAVLSACATHQTSTDERERHLANIRQLTHGGENAEAYFSPGGDRLVFQSTREGVPCDQIFSMRVDGTDLQRVSTGAGRTTCGYYLPGGQGIVYA